MPGYTSNTLSNVNVGVGKSSLDAHSHFRQSGEFMQLYLKKNKNFKPDSNVRCEIQYIGDVRSSYKFVRAHTCVDVRMLVNPFNLEFDVFYSVFVIDTEKKLTEQIQIDRRSH